MLYQQANPITNEEVNLNTYGNADSKVVIGPGDDAIVNAEARDVPGDESLTKLPIILEDLDKEKNVMTILVERKLVMEKVVLEEKEALLQEAIENHRKLETLKKVLEKNEALHQEAEDNLRRSEKVLEREKVRRQAAIYNMEEKEALYQEATDTLCRSEKELEEKKAILQEAIDSFAVLWKGVVG